MQAKQRIGIVENDELFREEVMRRLRALADVQSVKSWPSAEQFLRDAAHKDIDILFLDIMLSGITGIDLAGILSHRLPDMRIVMLTNMHSDAMVFDSIKNGALGYILKSELGNLEEIVNVVGSGGATITPTIALRVFSSFRKRLQMVRVLQTAKGRCSSSWSKAKPSSQWRNSSA